MLKTSSPLSSSIVTLLLASMLTQPLALTAENFSGNSTEAAAQRELARRMQREVLGREESEKGEAALENKDWEAAFAHYKNACENIPNARATRSSYADAVSGFAKSGIRLAEQRITEGYYATAVASLQEILKYDPDNGSVLKLLKNIEAPDYFNKQMTPKHRQRVEEIKADFIAAKGYQDLGRLALAQKRYEMALNKDPYNIAAHKGRQAVAEQKLIAAEAAAEHARASAMEETTREWGRPYRRFDRTAVINDESTKSTAPNTTEITKKLNSIIIPKVTFNETTIREAIDFLQQRAKALDPKGEGVNIVIKLDDAAGGAAPPSLPAPPSPPVIPGLEGIPGVTPTTSPQTAGGGSNQRITLTLSNVPLIEVLKYITNLANLKFKIEPFAVQIVPFGREVSEMFIKEWKVSPGLFRTGAASTGTGLTDPTAAPVADPTISGGGVLFPLQLRRANFSPRMESPFLLVPWLYTQLPAVS